MNGSLLGIFEVLVREYLIWTSLICKFSSKACCCGSLFKMNRVKSPPSAVKQMPASRDDIKMYTPPSTGSSHFHHAHESFLSRILALWSPRCLSVSVPSPPCCQNNGKNSLGGKNKIFPQIAYFFVCVRLFLYLIPSLFHIMIVVYFVLQ